MITEHTGRNFHPDGTPLTDDEVIELIRGETDTVLLSFSRGKDSIAAWLKLRPHFKRIVPYFMWIVPGLRFVEDSLKYYEDWFGERIYRVPHPQWYKMLREMVWQPAERLLFIEAMNLPKWTYDDCSRATARWAGLPDDTWTAHGTRMMDNLWRRANHKKSGAINWKRRTFGPIANMNKDELIETIASAGVTLPVDYHWFGCSFDAIDYKFSGAVRKHAPDDYAIMREWFPLIDLEIARYEGWDREQVEVDVGVVDGMQVCGA